jgi:two-component system, sensor histidine kinase and response regulator
MPLILIVDDEMYQRTLIRETLASDPSQEFVEAENGKQGLDEAQLRIPDVILLDVMMPGMNGFEVCAKLKANPRLRSVPIILVTALGQTQDKVSGLDSGADDFVNKPFEELELQARVRSALRIKAMHDELQQLIQMRDNLVKMIMHDMGNQVQVINSALTLYERLPPGSEEALQYVRDAYEANVALGDMIDDALDTTSLEARRMPLKREPIDVAGLLSSVVDTFRAAGHQNAVSLDLQIDPQMQTTAHLDKSLIRRVMANLLTNALKFSPENSTITVCFEPGGDGRLFRISVSDQGQGIAPEELETIFNKHETVQRYVDHRGRAGRGLGLTFCKLAVEAHGGSIWVHSEPGIGATFTVELPHKG